MFPIKTFISTLLIQEIINYTKDRRTWKTVFHQSRVALRRARQSSKRNRNRYIGIRVNFPINRVRWPLALALATKLISRIEKVTLQTPIQLTVKPRTSYFIQPATPGKLKETIFAASTIAANGCRENAAASIRWIAPPDDSTRVPTYAQLKQKLTQKDYICCFKKSGAYSIHQNQ